MSTIRVLHVIARMNVGGTARYVSELVENIPGSALATGYVQGAEIEDSTVESLPMYRLRHMGRKISPLNDFQAWLELRKLVKELKPQIIHTHTFKAGLIGRLVGGEHRLVHTFHGHLFGDQSFSPTARGMITRVERFLANRTDLLVSVGEKVGVELRAAGIGLNKKWVSIPPGVNSLVTIDKAEARRKLGLDHDGILFGWMARMVEVKNPLLLLQVAKRLPQVNFVMAGGGTLLSKVVTTASSNVAVIGWADATIFWSAVNCAISTSDNEGMPIALIEAQLAGLPVIATDVGSNSEVISHGSTGLVVNRDVDSLVRAVNEVIQMGTRRVDMGHASKKWAEQQFSIARLLQDHESNYAALL